MRSKGRFCSKCILRPGISAYIIRLEIFEIVFFKRINKVNPFYCGSISRLNVRNTAARFLIILPGVS